MKRFVWISISAISLVVVASALMMLSPRWEPVSGQASRLSSGPPPFLAWVEFSRDPQKKGVMEAYPLFAVTGDSLLDISFDPEDDKAPWESLSADRFPLLAKPALEGYLRGKPCGILRVDSCSPVQVACNALVLGRLDWSSKAGRIAMPSSTPGFVAAYHLPRQSSWVSNLPEDRKHELEAQFRTDTITRFGLPAESEPRVFQREWVRMGDGRGDAVFFGIQFKSGEELRTVSAVIQYEEPGNPKKLWEVVGKGLSESEEGVPIYELLDAFDVDGDGVPELLLGYHNYESNCFVLLRVRPGIAAERWSGSGYGC